MEADTTYFDLEGNESFEACPDAFEHQCFNSIPHHSKRHPNCPTMVRDHGREACDATEVRQSCALTCGMCSKEESVLRGNQVKIIHEKTEEEDEVAAKDAKVENIFTGIPDDCPNGAELVLIDEDVAALYGVSPKMWKCTPGRVDAKI